MQKSNQSNAKHTASMQRGIASQSQPKQVKASQGKPGQAKPSQDRVHAESFFYRIWIQFRQRFVTISLEFRQSFDRISFEFRWMFNGFSQEFNKNFNRNSEEIRQNFDRMSIEFLSEWGVWDCRLARLLAGYPESMIHIRKSIDTWYRQTFGRYSTPPPPSYRATELPSGPVHIHVGVVDLVFGLHIDFDFGTVHRRESRSEAQVVSIDANTYAMNAWMYRLQKPHNKNYASP